MGTQAAETKPFLSADELGVTPQEREGLIAVMEYLRRPQAISATGSTAGIVPDTVRSGEQIRVGFNMSVPTGSFPKLSEYHCGCAACIGGFLSLHMQGVPVLAQDRVWLTVGQQHTADEFVSDNSDSRLGPLFYPPSDQIISEWGGIRTETAAAAIEIFLTSGRADWRAAARRAGQVEILVGKAA